MLNGQGRLLVKLQRVFGSTRSLAAALAAAAFLLPAGSIADAQPVAEPATPAAAGAGTDTETVRTAHPPLMAGTLDADGADSLRAGAMLPDGGWIGVVQRPTDPFDLAAWLNFRHRNHIEALPQQARLFHRRGLMLHASGQKTEALRLVHGAAELDPHYIAPHLSLAAWSLLSNPSQALLQYAVVLELSRSNFLMQLALLANSLYLVMQAFVLGLLATGLFIVAVKQRELRHGWTERLARFTSTATARWWAWALLLLPFVVGFGPVLPTVILLGLLWPILKLRERFVFVFLVICIGASPLLISAMDRLAIPLRTSEGPFHGVTLLESDVDRPEVRERLAHLSNAEPHNGFVHFGHAWMSRRAGDIASAEASYRRVLSAWPNDDRTLNNLANTLAMSGREDEALKTYRRAVEANPGNASAHFNMSQILTRQFEYRDATNELSRASALDFDMVKAYQSRQTDDGFLPLVDQWIHPSRFWAAVSALGMASTSAPSLPPVWRSRVEFSGWIFSGTFLLAALAAVVLGIRMHRSIPLRTCSNCGEIVCRRCAERRRELALCRTCATVEKQAESPEFARVLLAQRKRSIRNSRHLARTALATLIPGLGLLMYQRVFGALLLTTITAGLALVAFGLAGPFPYEAGLGLSSTAIPLPVLIGMCFLLYAMSLGSYFSLVKKARAQAEYLARPQRSRVAQVGSHPDSAAA